MKAVKRQIVFIVSEGVIVLAIIFFLAAIAEINFIEVLARSKVSACKSDLCAPVLMIESNRVNHDNNLFMGQYDSMV